MKRILLPALFLLLASSIIHGQKTINGEVYDAASGEPLIGATIVLEGTTVGTITDTDGKFTLQNLSATDVMVISYVGYVRERVQVGEQTEVRIMLREDLAQIEEIIVTAIGIKSEKKALGYAAQEVSGDDVTNAQQSNIVNALSSKVAGINVTSSSGTPGASSDITIRGRTSLRANGNSPLFVIDGVPIDNSYAGSYVYDYSNRAIDLNSDDIESISVLKGAAASALYGIRAANGAIIITTKSGQGRGAARKNITFKTSLGIDQVNKLPEQQNLYSQGTDGNYSSSTNRSWGALIDTLRFDGAVDYPLDRNGRIVGMSDPAATDKRVVPYDNTGSFFENAITSNNYLSMSGGSDRSNYFFSAGYLNQNGIVPKTDFKRASFKLSGDTRLTDKFGISGSATYTNSKTNHAQRGSNLSAVMVGLMRCTPTFDLTNGSSDPANDPDAYMLPDGTQRNFYPNYDNPYWSVNKNRARSQVNRIIGNAQVDYEMLPWLRAMYRAGIDYYTEQRNAFFDNNSSDTPNGYVTASTYNFQGINSDLLITAEEEITKDIKLTASVGHNYYYRNTYTNSQRGDSLILPDFYDLSNTAVTEGSDYQTNYKIVGVFYDVRLSYKSMLYINTTGRNDWSSTLAKGNNSFFYPSVNASFIFSELLNLPNNSFFSYGKLRTSWAEVGNDAPIYSLQDYYTAITGGINGQTSFATQRTIGNNELQPETTRSSEVGIDFRFFQNKLGFDLALYQSKSIGQIVEVPVAYSTGYDHMIMNAGVLTNRGIEIQAFATPVNKSGLKWDIMVNLTSNKNMVDELPEGIPLLEFETTGVSSTRSVAIEGEPYGVIYGSRFLRNEAGQVLVSDEGYPRIDAVAGVVGDPNHKYTMGINNTLSYRGLVLTALIDIKQGGQMYNGTRNVMNYLGTQKFTENRDEDYIFPGVNENTGLPNDVPVKRDATYYSRQGTLAGLSEAAIEDASLVRLRQVNLYYTLPARWFVNSFINQLNIGLSGRNLLLFTPYSGIDPETNLSGVSNSLGRDYYNMPNTRGFEFSLQVSF
jgi:TonB-linked SusC/RagA family outer membrane protein